MHKAFSLIFISSFINPIFSLKSICNSLNFLFIISVSDETYINLESCFIAKEKTKFIISVFPPYEEINILS